MRIVLLTTLCSVHIVFSKIHHLTLRGDARRNIPLTSFGYAEGGTFDLVLINFTVPETILEKVDSRENADKSGVIGFSFSRGSSIASGVGSNPHVCQLQQTDQGFDAVFFLLTCRRNVFEYFDQEQENIFIFVLLTMSALKMQES